MSQISAKDLKTKKYLKDYLSVEITGYVEQVGEIIADQIDFKEINNNAFFFPDKTKLKSLWKKYQLG